MVTNTIDEEKRKIEIKKQKIQIKEKILKEREKRLQFRRYAQIGELAGKAGISHLNDQILIGAFIEISERSKDPKVIKAWEEYSNEITENTHSSDMEALTISFDSEPEIEMRNKLKDIGFKWNSFRKEYYGYGDRSKIENFLKGSDYNMESVK